ncbi:peptide ABC transporter substrate-binding protein [Clostridium botulinum]|uniref:Oligopeptide-binding protein OppA n=1 Tax=Clostridium botulinum (strain Eklund 17B / Type B) TaxID=935198 RepID=B2TS70_CLOBB|nr:MULTISPECIES: peptide ABC transporter substrate-binding protein [unclassified Clostridium]ACD22729.1 oligopeptide-binding protein OppA [Clostridium botulinum B str. Eklund 17B (NRP)]MBN1052740.1 peptide ABC transporter substrate-binding protein [Clostridium botulinum]MBY6976008.1 peptide ABC transporter substrate-binding protein [Clostridium botulinum]MBY7000431.1 peptide ABC transporter substrate-binding protein [Clostridium botulinum]MCR1273191.1 peptide ABC transporter substrate-binding 
MKTSKIKKLCAITLALTLGFSSLVGCGGGSSNDPNAQVITYNLNSDPKTLDPALNEAVESGTVIVNAFEGLYKLDENNKAIPGIAEKCDISEDGTVYTFHIRDGVKWSNGDVLTANDFEYSWKRVLNPATASGYAFQMSYIKGGEAYNQGKGSLEDVGIKAIDDKTLEVTLAAPCSYFLELTAFPCYLPVNKGIVEANKDAWALNAETYVSNGPFKITKYGIKDEIVLEKNENYYDANNIKLDKLNVKLVAEDTSAWASFQTGDFDMVDIVPTSEIEGALADGTGKKCPLLGTGFYVINVSDSVNAIDPNAAKALQDKRVRKALNLAIDRPSIINNILKNGSTPATGFVPQGIKNPNGTDFADKKYFKAEADIEEAKKLLAEAGYPNGEGFPNLVVLINPTNPNGDVAQAMQDMWKNNLGINVELQSQEWKVFQTTRTAKQYEVAFHAWVGDYIDPMTFLDMWESTSGQNCAGYNNPEYDKLIRDAKVEQDQTKRFEMLHQAEDMLMEDMFVIPLNYQVKVKGIKDYVKGVNVSPLGYIYFDKAYVEGK